MSDQKNLVEISITGTLRIELSDEMMDEVMTKMLTQEPIKLGGYELILDSRNYDKDITPTNNFLIYLDAWLNTEAQKAI